jgi:hypothetical protein
MNNYWLAHVEKPNVHDKIEIRKLLFEVRDDVFEYINSLSDIADWQVLCELTKNFLVELMFGYYQSKKISHFGVAKYDELGSTVLKLSIQPREWTEYMSVEFILMEPQDAIHY